MTSEAERLAQALERCAQGITLGAEGMGWGPSPDHMIEAAAELRRLSADAQRYAWLKSKAHENTAWDRYEGSHWTIGVYDHKSQGLDAAIDQAIGRT